MTTPQCAGSRDALTLSRKNNMKIPKQKMWRIQAVLPERIAMLIIPDELYLKMDSDDLKVMFSSAANSYPPAVQAVCDGVAQWENMGENYMESNPVSVRVEIESSWDDEIIIEGEEEEEEDQS